MPKIIFKTETEEVVLTEKEQDAIVRALRLLLLVGNDGESSKAASLLDRLLPKE